MSLRPDSRSSKDRKINYACASRETSHQAKMKSPAASGRAKDITFIQCRGYVENVNRRARYRARAQQVVQP